MKTKIDTNEVRVITGESEKVIELSPEKEMDLILNEKERYVRIFGKEPKVLRIERKVVLEK